MAIGWIEAVRDLWVEDAEIDFDALEKKWQLRTFETGGGIPTQDGSEPERGRLFCCMTGFEDIEERQKIVDKIESNGGVYMGDLTRRVTHLVVYKAEGRKYQAARGWGVNTVSIEWINDSIARGMILDEKCYDPILPVEQRGVGAWNKKTITRTVSLGKRARDDSVQEEGKRKLRKTASMKLNSQRENIWGDILRKPATSEPPPAAETAPAPKPAEPAEQSGRTKSMDTQMTRLSSFGASEDGMVFASCGFYVHGFSDQKTAVVMNAISSLGGLVCNSLDEVSGASGAQLAHRFLVVPQVSTAETHPPLPENVHIITQFYIERCMHKKYFFDPCEHVFGRPFPVYPILGFEKLTICTAGFTGVDLNHMDKALRQLGAKYEERFTPGASVLVCSSLSSVRAEKLQMARSWRVPVVNADWLWECISAGFNVPIKAFLFPELKQNVSSPKEAGGRQDKRREMIDKDLLPKPAPRPVAKAKTRRDMDSSGFSPMNLGGSNLSESRRSAATDRRPSRADESMATTTTHFETAPTHQLQMDSDSAGASSTNSANKSVASAPLSETSASALNRAPQPTPQPSQKTAARKPISRVVSEIADSEATDGDFGTATPTPLPLEPDVPRESETPAEKEAPPEEDAPQENAPEDPEIARKRIKAEKAAFAAAERLAISSKLTSSLLNSAALEPIASGPDGSADSAPSRMPPRRRKREVLGRAVSNVSAASSASGGGGDNSGSATVSFATSAAAIAAAGKVTETAAQATKNELPSGTQIQYEDKDAQTAKNQLLHKIMGKKGAAPAAPKSDRLTFSDIGGFDGQQALEGTGRRSRRK